LTVIEYNLEVIKTADWIVDLGPEGGDAGGHVVSVGTPEEIAANLTSYTWQYLKQVFDRSRKTKRAAAAE
jgi:excinuclease ABC subunit A